MPCCESFIIFFFNYIKYQFCFFKQIIWIHVILQKTYSNDLFFVFFFQRTFSCCGLINLINAQFRCEWLHKGFDVKKIIIITHKNDSTSLELLNIHVVVYSFSIDNKPFLLMNIIHPIINAASADIEEEN